MARGLGARVAAACARERDAARAFATARGATSAPPELLQRHSGRVSDGPPLLDARQQQEMLADEYDAEQRAVEIARIAADVGAVATLFEELNGIVVEQGTMLDRIDANMDSAVVSTAGGVRELRTAETHQRSASSCARWCMYGLLAVIAALILAIVLRKTA